eukprot:3124336-Alexandrium_andersonii.AAC.1
MPAFAPMPMSVPMFMPLSVSVSMSVSICTCVRSFGHVCVRAFVVLLGFGHGEMRRPLSHAQTHEDFPGRGVCVDAVRRG